MSPMPERRRAAFFREELARERTVLANERTFLAYLRTSIMLAVSGISIFHLMGDHLVYSIVGILLILMALVPLVVGYIRFRLFAGIIGDRIQPGPEEEEEP